MKRWGVCALSEEAGKRVTDDPARSAVKCISHNLKLSLKIKVMSPHLCVTVSVPLCVESSAAVLCFRMPHICTLWDLCWSVIWVKMAFKHTAEYHVLLWPGPQPSLMSILGNICEGLTLAGMSVLILLISDYSCQLSTFWRYTSWFCGSRVLFFSPFSAAVSGTLM